MVGDSATPYAKRDWLRVDHFRVAHLRVPLMMTATAAEGYGGEAQMAATAVEAWGERWTTPEGRARCSSPSCGFAVEAIDGAPAGLDFVRGEAVSRGLRLSLRQADTDALPFANESFDYVLSWNVIFRGTMGDVGRRFAEIWRVLRAGRLSQGMMLSKRDMQFGRGRPRPTLSFVVAIPRRTHTTIAIWPVSPSSWPALSFCR